MTGTGGYGGSTIGTGGGFSSGSPYISSTGGYDTSLAAANLQGQWGYKGQQLSSQTQEEIANQQYALGQQQLGVQSSLGEQQQALANATQQAQQSQYAQTLGYQYGMANQQQNQFNAKYQPLSQAMANPTNFGGAPSQGEPGISTGPIWTPQQVQAQVNQSNAYGLQGAQTQQRQAANQMAGQGFGSQSPALQQIQQNSMSQAIAGNAANANNIQYQAAQGNAQQQLAEQTQAQTGWYQAQQQDIQRRALNEQYQSSLANAMAGVS